MKVNSYREVAHFFFAMLGYGDVFLFNGHLAMKIQPSPNPINAVSLDMGLPMLVPDNECVLKVYGEYNKP